MTSPLNDPASWVDLYADALYRFALIRVNDAGLAEDLVQETFLAALKAKDSFSGASAEKTWLISILKHKIIDHYRKTARRDTPVELPSDDDFDERGMWKLSRAPQAWPDNPDEEYSQGEFWTILQRCLERLPERIAAVFSMREIDGYDSKEICKELDLSSSNLWVILHRARASLRKCLQSLWIKQTSETK